MNIITRPLTGIFEADLNISPFSISIINDHFPYNSCKKACLAIRPVCKTITTVVFFFLLDQERHLCLYFFSFPFSKQQELIKHD